MHKHVDLEFITGPSARVRPATPYVWLGVGEGIDPCCPIKKFAELEESDG
jgi:hypothetical protein